MEFGEITPRNVNLGDAFMIRQLLATGTSAIALVIAAPALADETTTETETTAEVPS